MPPYNLLCCFSPSTGWRVHSCSSLTTTSIGVLMILGIKYLVIPALEAQKGGWFCNPKKLALAYVRHAVQQARIVPAPSLELELEPEPELEFS